MERVVPIHELNKKRTSDTIFGLDITNPNGQRVETNVILNKEFEKEFLTLNDPLKNLLESVDKENKVKILFRLLKETLENEG